jgi:mannose-6-phosphate isomerase-like protein (cupin superfamily)
MPGYTVFRGDALPWAETSTGGDRSIVRLSDALNTMRSNLWRLGPATSIRRHAERVQDELFVAIDGSATMLLGDPPERVELPRGSVVAVQAGTPLQVRNDSSADAVVVIVGAPPAAGETDYLDDVT